MLIYSSPFELRERYPRSTVVKIIGDVALMDSENDKGAHDKGAGFLAIIERHDGDRKAQIMMVDAFDRKMLYPRDVQPSSLRWRLNESVPTEVAERFRAEGLVNDEGIYGEASPMVMDFGYCRTVHTAQGDEADHVVYAESARWMRGNRRNTLKKLVYTAATRARKKLSYIDALPQAPVDEDFWE